MSNTLYANVQSDKPMNETIIIICPDHEGDKSGVRAALAQLLSDSLSRYFYGKKEDVDSSLEFCKAAIIQRLIQTGSANSAWLMANLSRQPAWTQVMAYGSFELAWRQVEDFANSHNCVVEHLQPYNGPND